MINARLTTTIAAAVALLAPAAAPASTLTLDGRSCYEQDERFEFTGTGFSPEINLSFNLTESGFPDENGDTAGFFHTPVLETYVPQTLSLIATDQDPSRSTQATFFAVKFGSNLPIAGGRLRDRVTWQFAGFPAGSTVYGHFRQNNRTVKNVRFGRVSGPCGTLRVNARRIPVPKAKRKGGWYVQVDTSPRFSFATRPEYDRTI
ncbi:MAG: hypothetical protein JHC95_01920 [Solirubrobacteraceae bacterium]|nr:hypothetical protein [Solirubrobacteraceae bacterium]